MKTSYFSAALIAVALFAFGSVTNANYVYDFNSLTTGDLNGQDNWVKTLGTATVTAASSSSNYASGGGFTGYRTNNSNFTFPNPQSLGGTGGGSVVNTSFTLAFDVQSNASCVSYMALASGATGYSMMFGVFSEKFSINDGAVLVPITATLLPGYETGDWLQVKMVETISTSKKTVASAVLYARDLTKGATTWTQVANYTPTTDIWSASAWDGFWLRLSTATSNVDNLTIGEPTIAPVPEPTSIALLISGILGLLAYAWRKRKN